MKAHDNSGNGLVMALLTIAGVAGLLIALTGCGTSTYSVYTPGHDGTVVRTDITMEDGLHQTLGEPEFMRIRDEKHYDAKTGKLLGGRTCEQSYVMLTCK